MLGSQLYNPNSSLSPGVSTPECPSQERYLLIVHHTIATTKLSKMPAKTEKDPASIAFARTLENTPWCEDYEKMISGVL